MFVCTYIFFSFVNNWYVGNSWVPHSLSGHNAREESEREDKNDKLGESEKIQQIWPLTPSQC